MIGAAALDRLVGQRRTLAQGRMAGIPATITAVSWRAGRDVMLVLTYDEGVDSGPKTVHQIDALLSETRKVGHTAMTYVTVAAT